MTTHTIYLGDTVLCDLCNKEYLPDTPGEGGIVFGSRAVCPSCAPQIISDATKYDELDYIKAQQPLGVTFHEWVTRDLRGGEPGKITVTSLDDPKELHNLLAGVFGEKPLK